MNRLALRVLIGSVAVSAVLGCLALLSGDFGAVQGKVLLSSLTISGASILAMACAPALERRLAVEAAWAGIGASILAAVLVLLGMWAEAKEETFWKGTGTVVLLAVAISHGCLLSLAPLSQAHRWIRAATLSVSALLTLLLLLLLWETADAEDLWRVLGVLSILLCAGTILVPVLGRSGHGGRAPLAEAARFCPGCGSAVGRPSRAGTCTSCGVRYEVRLRK